MNDKVIQLHKLTFTNSRGAQDIEYCIGTYQQLNDYAIDQASVAGCVWDSLTIDQGGFAPTFNIKGIDQVKILTD